MHILARTRQKAAALGLVSIFMTGRWSEQTSVETHPSVNEYSPVRRCHCNAFQIVSFCLIFIDIIKVPQCSGFARKNRQKLTSQPHQLYLIQLCISGIPAVQCSRVSHVLNANFIVPPSHMLWKMESATVMIRLLANPQLSKSRTHWQVGRCKDVCLSKHSTFLPFLQLTLFLSVAKRGSFPAIFLSSGACLGASNFY